MSVESLAFCAALWLGRLARKQSTANATRRWIDPRNIARKLLRGARSMQLIEPRERKTPSHTERGAKDPDMRFFLGTSTPKSSARGSDALRKNCAGAVRIREPSSAIARATHSLPHQIGRA